MESDWFTRLEKAIRDDPRSLRALSLAAGRGENYVQQLLNDKKEPGVSKVIGLLDVLGAKSTLFVMLGIEFSADDEEFFKILLSSNQKVRAQVLDLFRAMQADEPA